MTHNSTRRTLYIASVALGSIVAAYATFSTLSHSVAAVDALPHAFDQMIERQIALPRYVEAGYSPLGRSPVVDAVLGTPFYFPCYVDTVAKTLKTVSEEKSLYTMSTAVMAAGGIPIGVIQENFSYDGKIPEEFAHAFGENARKMYAYFKAFMQVENEVKETLGVLSEEEKRWLQENYDAFFFGKKLMKDEYDFFTTKSPMPLKFFEMASRVDIVRLTECARKLSLIADAVMKQEMRLETPFFWKEAELTFMVSNETEKVYSDDIDFFIDLGGHNSFLNNAGGTKGVKAASLHIDMKGNNHYEGDNFVQGSGFLGVGVLANRAGNNVYKAKNYAQGSGFFGVGLLMNQEGNNSFEVDFGGQSVALFGASLLWNQGGHNTYVAHEGMAQAASSTMGVAFLVDNEGFDVYRCGLLGQGGKRSGGIGQGGATGMRGYPWQGNPSFYGGVAFLYNGGGQNRFTTPWLGQGSAYFLGVGVLVIEGSHNELKADFDAQGQGLHMGAGMLLKRGGHDRLEGGWGSLGVAGDRSVGMLIGIGGNSSYQGSDQSVGTARKDKTLGLFIETGGQNSYEFKKVSNGSIQWPSSPEQWSEALFMELGRDSQYPNVHDGMKRGAGRTWGVPPHSIAIDVPVNGYVEAMLFAKFPKKPMHSSPFDPVRGWKENVAFRPIKRTESVEKLAEEIIAGDYDKRRQLYESLDLMRFTKPSQSYDLSILLENPGTIPEDQLNYALLWAIANQKDAFVGEVAEALSKRQIHSAYARKIAILYVGKMGSHKEDAILADIMLTDPLEENQATAAKALASLSDAAALKLLAPGVLSESEMVRYAIAKALQNNKTPGVIELIEPLLADSSFYVRRAAALTLISLGDVRGIPVLLDTLRFDTLDTEENYGDNIYAQLAVYVGVDFGVDKAAWLHWWQKNRTNFQFPKSER